ncbi:PAS domain-containing protein [Saliphagus sp. GCM10025308]
METHAAPLHRPDGTTSQLALTRDITEQIERERELERTLDLLEKTERIADVGGWEINPETKDVFWTDHIFELLEVDADEEPPLEDALDMYHEDDQGIVEDAVENALVSGDPFDVEARIRTNSGDIRWLRLQGVPEVVDNKAASSAEPSRILLNANSARNG